MEERHYGLRGGQKGLFFRTAGEGLPRLIKLGSGDWRSLFVKGLSILYTGNVCVNK